MNAVQYERMERARARVAAAILDLRAAEDYADRPGDRADAASLRVDLERWLSADHGQAGMDAYLRIVRPRVRQVTRQERIELLARRMVVPS